MPTDGQPVVLNVWASWCGPCRAEVGELEEAARLRPDAHFVGIDGKESSPQNGQAFQRANAVSYDSIYDPDGSILVSAGIFPTSYFPSTAVLDTEGRVAALVVGEVDASTVVGILDDVG